MSIEIVKDYMFFFIFFCWGNWNKNVGGVFELSYGKFGEFVVKSFLYQVRAECRCKRLSRKENRVKLL